MSDLDREFQEDWAEVLAYAARICAPRVYVDGLSKCLAGLAWNSGYSRGLDAARRPLAEEGPFSPVPYVLIGVAVGFVVPFIVAIALLL